MVEREKAIEVVTRYLELIRPEQMSPDLPRRDAEAIVTLLARVPATVTDEMVDRALDAYQAVDGDIAYQEPMRAALEASLTSGDAPAQASERATDA